MATSRPFGYLASMDPFRELRRLQEEIDRRIGGSSTVAPGGSRP